MSISPVGVPRWEPSLLATVKLASPLAVALNARAAAATAGSEAWTDGRNVLNTHTEARGMCVCQSIKHAP